MSLLPRLRTRRSWSPESTSRRGLFERSEFPRHLIRGGGGGTPLGPRLGENGFGPFEGLSQKSASCVLVAQRPQRTYLYASAFSLPAALLANFLNSPYCRNKSVSSRGDEIPAKKIKPGIPQLPIQGREQRMENHPFSIPSLSDFLHLTNREASRRVS